MEDKNIQKELERLAPSLDKNKRQRQQELPNGYFDKLQQKILTQNTDKQVVKPKTRSIFNFKSVAAFLVILIGLSVWLFNFSTTQKQIEPLADNDILEYIDDHITEFSEYEIGEDLEDNELTYSLDISDDEIFDEIDNEDFPFEIFEEQL